MLQHAKRTTAHKTSGPASASRMGVWGNNVRTINGRIYRVWLFILESNKRLKAYEHLPERAAKSPENGCTFYGEGARHVGLECMRASRHCPLPIMYSWFWQWDASKKVEVWTFVSEGQQVFTAELMQSNCPCRALVAEKPKVWVSTRREAE